MGLWGGIYGAMGWYLWGYGVMAPPHTVQDVVGQNGAAEVLVGVAGGGAVSQSVQQAAVFVLQALRVRLLHSDWADGGERGRG